MTTAQTENNKKPVPEAVKQKCRKVYAKGFGLDGGGAGGTTFMHERLAAVRVIRSLESKWGFKYGPTKHFVMPDGATVDAEVEPTETGVAQEAVATANVKPVASQEAKKATKSKPGTRTTAANWDFVCSKCGGEPKPEGEFRVLSIKGRQSYRLHICRACECQYTKDRAAAKKANGGA